VPVPSLDKLEIPTAEGLWRSEYIGDPQTYADSTKVCYYIRFKWVDPNNPENKATPEKRMRLSMYREDLTSKDAEEKLKAAVYWWLEAPEECEALFSYESRYLLKP
jgi:hypothetical protein